VVMRFQNECQIVSFIETYGRTRENLAKNQKRTEKFNIHGCWKWVEGNVTIYEVPSMPHETGIGAIVEEIMDACRPVKGIPSQIYKTRDRNCEKEADALFRPTKLAVNAPNGSNGNNRLWPNLVMKVAYTETLDHVEEALKYWLSPGRAHNCIIVKIDPVLQDQVPVRMR
ncbi:15815_t:CDS:2, partial [Funneliformis mosseae]